MPQSAQLNKLNTEVGELKREVRSLRSLFISVIGKDAEGVYRPKVIKEVLRAAKERPGYAFTDPRSFLAQLRRV